MTVQTDLTRCTYKTAKGRQCKLAPNHEGDHRMILRDKVNAPKPLSEVLPAGFTLSMEAVPKDVHVGREYQRAAAPRDKDQQRVDKDAKRAYDVWAKAGKPNQNNQDGTRNVNFPWQRYIFPPAAFDTIVAMLRRATQAGGPVQGKRFTYTRHTHESGNAMIYFAFTDPKLTNGGNGN